MSRDRGGGALVLAVLLSIAATLLAHGVLVLAREELIAARSGIRVLRLEHLAVLAARQGSEHLSRTVDPTGAGADSGRVGEAVWRGHALRIADEIWLAEGEAVEREARRRLAVPLWRLDPIRRVGALGAVVTTGGTAPVLGSQQILPEPPSDGSSPLPPGACSAESSQGQPLHLWSVAPDSSGPRLGRLDAPLLREWASVRVSNNGRPEPREDAGLCVAAPWNWGEPGATDGPCGAFRPLVAAEPGVRVEGGQGQGTVVARGDLTLAGTTFYGVLLVDGTLRLEGDATVTGLIIARSGADFGPESRVIGSRCWAEFVLFSPEVRRAAPIVHGGWIWPSG